MHTWNTQDIAGYFSCLHEDYQMIFHSTGKSLRLEDFDMDQLARWMISTTRESARCIYENEDILVEHPQDSFQDKPILYLLPQVIPQFQQIFLGNLSWEICDLYHDFLH